MKTYQVMLGDHHFSESLITAEWLYDSMKKAQAIDLTVIGMGYFKAVERVLFELICLHKMKTDTSKLFALTMIVYVITYWILQSEPWHISTKII